MRAKKVVRFISKELFQALVVTYLFIALADLFNQGSEVSLTSFNFLLVAVLLVATISYLTRSRHATFPTNPQPSTHLSYLDAIQLQPEPSSADVKPTSSKSAARRPLASLGRNIDGVVARPRPGFNLQPHRPLLLLPSKKQRLVQ